jgi:hypothetical protein
MTDTKIASPLSRKATLVAVNISMWTARKLDKKITKATNRRYNASDDAGRYNKLLIEAERLAKITKLVSAARALHYSLTQPWADDGPRILPNALYSKFVNEFRVIKRDFDIAADEFCRDYPEYVRERRVKLNGMFNEQDYPSVKEIRSKFALTFSVMPFPNAADFRADLDDDVLEDIKREISGSSVDAVDAAKRDSARRITELVGHMATKLKEYSVGKKRKARNFFCDSLVENVRELADLLPAFNLTDDPDLDRITARITKELCAEAPAVLRQNAKARAVVAKSADEIVAEVERFLA